MNEDARYDEVVERLGASDAVEDRTRVSRALYAKAFRFAQHGQLDAALGVYDDLLRRNATDRHPDLLADTARALVSKGVALSRANRLNEAIELFDEVLRRFDNDPDIEFREQVARALGNKAFVLAELVGDPEGAVIVYDDLLDRFGSAPEPELRELVLIGASGMANSLRGMNQLDESLHVCHEFIRRFADTETQPSPQLADTSVLCGDNLRDLGRMQEAIEMFNEVVARYGASSDVAIQAAVARALNSKGITLWRLDRHHDALVVFDEVIAQYGDVDSAAVRNDVAAALYNSAVMLDETADRDALAAYAELVERFREDSEPFIKEMVERARSRLEWLSDH